MAAAAFLEGAERYRRADQIDVAVVESRRSRVGAVLRRAIRRRGPGRDRRRRRRARSACRRSSREPSVALAQALSRQDPERARAPARRGCPPGPRLRESMASSIQMTLAAAMISDWPLTRALAPRRSRPADALDRTIDRISTALLHRVGTSPGRQRPRRARPSIQGAATCITRTHASPRTGADSASRRRPDRRDPPR